MSSSLPIIVQRHHKYFQNGTYDSSTALGADYAATRDLIKGDVTAAGGYNNLSAEEKQIVNLWFLVDDLTERAVQFKAYAARDWQARQDLADAKNAEVKDADTLVAEYQANVDAAQTALEAAYTAATAIEGDTRWSAWVTAQNNLNTKLAAKSTAYQTFQTATQAVQDDPHDTAYYQNQVSSAQASLDQDPTNVTLQEALTSAQAALTARQALLSAQTDAQTAYQTAYQQAEDANAAYQTATQDKNEVSSYPYQATLGDKYSELDQAESNLEAVNAKLAVDPGNAEFKTQQTAYSVALTSAQAAVQAADTRRDQQRAILVAQENVTYYGQLLSGAQSVSSALTAQHTLLQASADELQKTDSEWDAEGVKEYDAWSDTYHTSMSASRAHRVKEVTLYCYRELGTAQAQVIGLRLLSLKDLYVQGGLKGVARSNPLEGFYDYWLSTAGTSFETNGFVDQGYTPLNASLGVTLAEIRDHVVNLLDHGE